MNLAEGVQSVALGILGVMMIGAALGVVLFSNIVYSAFLLGGVFISIAGMYLLLNGDFVASAQILIYVGAINVLILFAIMLVNKRQDFSPLPSAGLRKVFTAIVSFGLFARHLPVATLYCKNCPSAGELVKSTSAKLPMAVTPLPASILTSTLLPDGIGSVKVMLVPAMLYISFG